ncbi:MAG: hypothetical protein JOZ78_24805 [Chroococcidiopsidaceae cyanobacterium CP_BM_ER_R8_30]|nr:hypothetical protein [Chroococcidiopsidaceae cyanobacterium CP_BM_ER_R8_30]
MRLRKYLVITVIAAIGLIVFSSVSPVLSYQSSQNSQSIKQLQQPIQPGMLIADRGCDGAHSAKDSLQSAVDNLKKVSEESQVLSNALDYSVQGLRAVNRYIDQACR